MWVPLDILLTGCIFFYYSFYSLIESDEGDECSSDDEDELENEKPKSEK